MARQVKYGVCGFLLYTENVIPEFTKLREKHEGRETKFELFDEEEKNGRNVVIQKLVVCNDDEANDGDSGDEYGFDWS